VKAKVIQKFKGKDKEKAMLASNPISTPTHDHEFFDTLKRYA
jgi:hypothetical protein